MDCGHVAMSVGDGFGLAAFCAFGAWALWLLMRHPPKQ